MLDCPCERCGGDEPEYLCLNRKLENEIKLKQYEMNRPIWIIAIITPLLIALFLA